MVQATPPAKLSSERDALVPRNTEGQFTYLVTHFGQDGRISTMTLQLAPDIQAARREVAKASPLSRTRVRRASHKMVETVERMAEAREEKLRRMTF